MGRTFEKSLKHPSRKKAGCTFLQLKSLVPPPATVCAFATGVHLVRSWDKCQETLRDLKDGQSGIVNPARPQKDPRPIDFPPLRHDKGQPSQINKAAVASERPLSCLGRTIPPSHPHIRSKHTHKQGALAEEHNVSNKLDKAVLDKNSHIDHQRFRPAALKVQRRSIGGDLFMKPSSAARLSLCPRKCVFIKGYIKMFLLKTAHSDFL